MGNYESMWNIKINTPITSNVLWSKLLVFLATSLYGKTLFFYRPSSYGAILLFYKFKFNFHSFFYEKYLTDIWTLPSYRSGETEPITVKLWALQRNNELKVTKISIIATLSIINPSLYFFICHMPTWVTLHHRPIITLTAWLFHSVTQCVAVTAKVCLS